MEPAGTQRKVGATRGHFLASQSRCRNVNAIFPHRFQWLPGVPLHLPQGLHTSAGVQRGQATSVIPGPSPHLCRGSLKQAKTQKASGTEKLVCDPGDEVVVGGGEADGVMSLC